MEKMENAGQEGEDHFMSVAEAAEYLRVSRQSIYNHISQGRLPYHKYGARTLLKKSALDAALVEFGVKGRGQN